MSPMYTNKIYAISNYVLDSRGAEQECTAFLNPVHGLSKNVLDSLGSEQDMLFILSCATVIDKFSL